MICDDDRIMLNILESVIKNVDKNFLIYSFTDPENAIKIGNLVKFDYAFVDWVMPKYNGADVFKALNKDCVKILCTAKELNDDIRSEAVSAGADGLFNKPVNMQQIVKILADPF